MSGTAEQQGGDNFNEAVLACTQKLDEVLSELQKRYGTTAVLASLITVAGCSNCVGHEGEQQMGKSLRALIVRLDSHRAP
jgi:hypothetical protein